MYTVETTNKFVKDYRICNKRGLPMETLDNLISILKETGTLPQHYRPHKLSGRYSDVWECHIKPDWLLLWQQNDQELKLLMLRTGSHSDLF